MKPFDYYFGEKLYYPDRHQKRKELQELVDEQKLTRTERIEAYKLAEIEAEAWYERESEPWKREVEKLRQEFWQDCRTKLGYDKILTSEGIKKLESMIKGYDYEIVYKKLRKIVNLLRQVKEPYDNPRI